MKRLKLHWTTLPVTNWPQKVWVNKYALKDAFGNIYEESPVDMHHRLAREIARVEKKYL